MRADFRSLKFVIALALIISGCAGVKVKEEQAKKVKKVAILGIEIHQQQPKDALGLSMIKSMVKGETPLDNSSNHVAQKIVDELRVSLAKKFSWQIVDLKAMVKNSNYSELYEQRMAKSIRQTLPMAQGFQKLKFEGILDEVGVFNLSHEQKLKLARQLGADAYASLWITVSIDQGFSLGNLTGDADFSSKASMQMNVFDRSSGEEPILAIQNIAGDSTESSEKLPKTMTKFEKLNELGSRASISVINKAMQEIKL